MAKTASCLSCRNIRSNSSKDRCPNARHAVRPPDSPPDTPSHTPPRHAARTPRLPGLRRDLCAAQQYVTRSLCSSTIRDTIFVHVRQVINFVIIVQIRVVARARRLCQPGCCTTTCHAASGLSCPENPYTPNCPKFNVFESVLLSCPSNSTLRSIQKPGSIRLESARVCVSVCAHGYKVTTK